MMLACSITPQEPSGWTNDGYSNCTDQLRQGFCSLRRTGRSRRRAGIIASSFYANVEVVSFAKIWNEASESGPWLSGVVVEPVCMPDRWLLLPQHSEIDRCRDAWRADGLLRVVSEMFPNVATVSVPSQSPM